jgi:hypothetical protein
MAAANVRVNQILLRRGNTAAASTYTGPAGEVIVDTGLNTIRVQNGVTAGGTILATNAQIWSLSNTISSITGIDSSLLANASTQQTQINVINANLGAFQTYANATFGISSYGNANVKSYLTQFDGNILPTANVAYSLGSATQQWKDLWVSNATIYLNSVPLSTDATGNITYNGNPLVSFVDGNLSVGDTVVSGGGGNPFDQDLNANSAVTFYTVGATVINVSQINGTNPGNELVIQANNRNWIFGTDGNLTLPLGGDIVNSSGESVLGGNGGGSSDRLTNGEYSLILDSAGKLSFPGNLAIDNGVISNLNSIDEGALVVGSQIEVFLERTTITNQVTNSLGEGGPFLQTQSLIEVTAGNVTIGSQVTNSAGDGSSSLAVASLLQTNASNVIIGHATLNSLEESTLQTLNLVEINSNNVLIGQRVINSLNGNVTLDAFAGWEFSTDGNLTLPSGGDILNSNGQSVLTPVTVGNVTSGAEGALWYNTEDGRTYVYALDTWIDASPAVVPGNMVGYGQDGNITLNEDARINYANGVSIINSVYGDSQVANFLSAYTGNIGKIGATPLSIAAASVRLTSDNETWAFAPDGVITLPNGMSIESDGAPGVNATVTIGGNDTRISIYNDGAPPGLYITANATGTAQQWVFGPAGDLAFPDGSTQTTAYTGGGGGAGNALVNGAYTVALQANGVLTLGGTATISNASEEFRLWADNDITVYRNGQDGYGVKAGNIEVYTDNGLRTVTNSDGFELKTGNITIPNDKGVVFANGVNILSTIVGITSINTSVTSSTINDESGDFRYGSLSYDYAVNGVTSGGFTIDYSAPLVHGNVDVNVGNVIVTNIDAAGTIGANVIQVLSDLTSFGASPAPRIYGFSSIATTGSAVNEGNISASGNLVASRNAYISGNVIAGNVVSTGNVTASNFIGNISITGNVQGTSANVDLVAGSYSWKFDNTGNLVLPGNTFAVNYANNTPVNVVTKGTGSWTVVTGTNTYSFTVPASGTYQLWVDCNIPNGIIAWNATATVTNGNVPVVGVQYAWVYNGGGTPIDFVSIPNQFVGTANTIVRSSVSPSVTTNRFDFGINNTSGGNVTVRYGWIAIS